MNETAVKSEHKVFETAFHHVLNYLGGLEKGDVAATVDLKELRRRFSHDLPAHGTPSVEVINKLVESAFVSASPSKKFLVTA